MARRLVKTSAFALSAALLLALAGGAPRAQTPPPGREEAALLDQGRQLYAAGCLSCHGVDGRGRQGAGQLGAGNIEGAGPSLVGVGAASVDFYLTTGYMPLRRPDEIPKRGAPQYSPAQIDALVAYVTSFGGRRTAEGYGIPAVRPELGDLPEGKRLFTDKCAGCHQVVAEGGVVLDGQAPELERATATQIGEAIRVGPYLMPKFDPRQISDAEVNSIARYIMDVRSPRDEGGWGIGHIGPVAEGAVIWLVALLALVSLARLLGARVR
jgi:ubiquinol-cytochrome c reductase cytochrome c subunit